MQSLLLGLVTAIAALAWSPREVRAPERVEDPPIECPLCGGDASLHARILARLTSANADVALRALSRLNG